LIQPIYRLFIELTNNKTTSMLLAKFAQSRLSRMLIPTFIKVYNINTDEGDKKVHEYVTLHDFFTRKLKKGMRKIDKHHASVISPVDAVIQDVGHITPDKTIVVKGKTYSISEMVGNDKDLSSYINGTYIIFYLSPRHYHRIHSPISGNVENQWTIGRKSYPVNRLGLKYGKDPLSKNYRIITEVKCNHSKIMIVKVGAMFVNSIELIANTHQIEKGEEIAYFSFGSTVILLFETGTFEPKSTLLSQPNIKVGESIGLIKSYDK
jgi:phosphatidylserine decarboxylase